MPHVRWFPAPQQQSSLIASQISGLSLASTHGQKEREKDRRAWGTRPRYLWAAPAAPIAVSSQPWHRLRTLQLQVLSSQAPFHLFPSSCVCRMNCNCLYQNLVEASCGIYFAVRSCTTLNCSGIQQEPRKYSKEVRCKYKKSIFHLVNSLIYNKI